MADKNAPRSDQQGSASGWGLSDILRSLCAHDALFNDIDDNRPEGDIRLRFLRLRSIRAHFVEAIVKQREREYDELMKDVRDRRLDPETEDTQMRFEQQMIAVDKALDWSSRALEQDSNAAKAPVVNPYFMNNLFRLHLESPGRGIRAPNGELRSLYGSRGDPVSAHYTTPRGCDDDLFRGLILNNLLIPLDRHVYIPCRKLYNKLLNRSHEQEAHGLGGRILELIVSALETVLSVLCISGTVILLYNLKYMKERLIATTFLSLVFPYAVMFLSKEAMKMFGLTAAYWAVMVVFISTSNYSSKND